jgi:predicted GH43/DUF377 family glycosyl hydrolase
MTAVVDVTVRRSTERLRPDPSRVITRMFVPGHEGFDQQDSRAGAVLARILAMEEEEAQAAFDDVVARFDGRHRDLLGTFRRHASEVADRLDPARTLSDTRQLLLGATFTSEFALEGAAVCNPSIVAHPDQAGLPPGCLRFVMSFRAIGEGHRSSIAFRTGTLDASGEASIDPRSSLATTGTIAPVPLEAAAFRSELRRLGGDGEDTDFVLDPLGQRFTSAELEVRLTRVHANLATRRRGEQTIALVRAIAERTYGVRFPGDTSLPERVLWPAMGAERAGMEDARFVRFTHDDGAAAYYATYTAYDGNAITQQMLETADFVSFTSSPIVGAAAANKGLALFPRQIDGRFAALSRCDRETNTIAFSADPRAWTSSVPCQAPTRAWEVLQLGNCGSPIETEAGWLVLTHGVGPMRTYSIGALLLDLDDPSRILGQLRHPLLSPAADEQNGYVPNVVYSCGALVHAGTLVLPYGIGDAAIGFATVPMCDLLRALERPAGR